MKRTGRFIAAGFLFFVLTLTAGAQAPADANPWETPPAKINEVKSLGGPNAFVPGALTSIDSLRQFFVEEQDAIGKALEISGWAGDAKDLFNAARHGVIEETTFPVGARLHWMALKRGGRSVDIIPDIRWKGKAAFDAFVLRFPSNNSRWAFVVPKPCGNLALLAKMGEDDLTIVMTSGVLELVDAEGRPITIRAGGHETVSATYSDRYKGREVGKAGIPTTVKVHDGSVEFSEYSRPVAVMVTSGNEVSATLSAAGSVALAVPASNVSDLAIKVGDAHGTLKSGTGVSVEWPTPKCNIEVRTQGKACAPGTLEIDASKSSVERGTIAKVMVTGTLPNGDTFDLGSPGQPFTWTHKADQTGTYSFTAVALSNNDVSSPKCTAEMSLENCVPPPPTASLQLDSGPIAPYESIGMNGSQSSSDGGEISKVEINIYNAARRLFDSVTLSKPFTHEMEISNPGTYTFKATAIDNFDQRSTNQAEATLVVKPKKFYSLAPFIGYGSSGGGTGRVAEDGALAGLKVSYDRQFLRNWEFGLGLVLAYDEAHSQAAFGGDFVVDRLFGKGFAGLGVGFWDIAHNETSSLDIILRGGVALPWVVGDNPTHFFAEGRIGTGEPGGIADSYRVLAGIRFRPW